MNAKYLPLIVLSLMLAVGFLLLPASAQLPPTNRTPPPARPDISLDPIAADEPVPPAGFPPLPAMLDLPISVPSGWRSSSAGSTGGSRAPAAGGAPEPSFHQHYGHVPAGAYLPPQQQGEAVAPAAGGSPGYYKVRTSAPAGGDYYNANTGGAPGMTPPPYTGASPKDLKSLGREPRMNDRQDQDQSQAPEAPQPVTVNQAKTQDLSLPEDEFAYKAHQSNRTGKVITKTMTRMLMTPLNSMGGLAGGHF